MKQSSWFAIVLLWLASSVFAGKDPANYPLKVHILQQMWASHIPRYSEYRATGRGNIWDGDSVHGFDFTYDCGFGLQRTARNDPYLAKWKKPQHSLAILAREIGKTDKYRECEMKTTVHDGVYFLTNGGFTEMSQAEYSEWKAKRDAAKADQAKANPAAISRVSVTSAPDGGEIEIDGEFMGNTPSMLEVAPGEHSITVRKQGYKPWEKKMKLAPGEIKLNAELEQEADK